MPEFLAAGPVSVPATTGLKQYRLVTLSTATGKLVYPANGADVIGALFSDSSTHSTRDISLPVAMGPVVDVEAAGSTLAAGARVSASSIGRVVTWTTAKIQVGRILYGSSGTTGRIVGVVLNQFGHSTALT